MTVAPVIEKILHSHPPPEVEASAVDTLAAFDEPAAGKQILDNWRGYGPDGRKHAVSAMLAQRNRIAMLLERGGGQPGGALRAGRLPRDRIFTTIPTPPSPPRPVRFWKAPTAIAPRWSPAIVTW